jgi:hypothetical protein
MDDASTIVERLMPKLLNYLITESPGKTVAHCLDLDLVAVAETKQKATQDLDDLVRRQVRFITKSMTLSDLNFRAPQDFWNVYFDGLEIAKTHLELEVPPVGLEVVHRTQKLPVLMRSRSLA